MRHGISFERPQSLGYDQAMEQGTIKVACCSIYDRKRQGDINTSASPR